MAPDNTAVAEETEECVGKVGCRSRSGRPVVRPSSGFFGQAR